MKLIFIRHAEVDRNKHGFYLPTFDTPLNHAGIEQAEKAAERLKNSKIKIDRILTSDFTRTVQTAKIIHSILGIGSPIETDELLRESLSDFQITRLQEDSVPESIIQEYARNSLLYETDEERFERANKFITKKEQSDDGNSGAILCVTHGGIMRMLKYAALNYEFNAQKLESFNKASQNTEIFGINLDKPRKRRDIMYIVNKSNSPSQKYFDQFILQ